MSPSAVAKLLRTEKAAALEAGRGRTVEIDGTVIARIRLSWTRDREMEEAMDLSENEALTQVAFVHLTMIGESMVLFPWSATL